MLATLDALVARARRSRAATLAIINLRILIGFAFVPAGLKKLLAEPFTDPGNAGRFHDFLHAFHGTGGFYRFVGIMQLAVAVLLSTQRFATAGAALALPIVTAICVFCWSTAVYPTAVVVTLMLGAVALLLLWDLGRWRGLFLPDGAAATVTVAPTAPVDRRLWALCGLAVIGLYLLVCALHGGVYRPRGARPDQLAFYVMPAIALMPIVTLLIDRARYRRRAVTA